MTISNAHYMFIFFPPDCHFFLISSPLLPQSFSPRPRNPSRSLPFIATEIHSTCPLIGILLFLYLCIPLFIQNHMLMKSVIINLKYLIFRSVSASEGGWLEEQQQQQRRRRRQWWRGEGRGEEDGKSRAVASALSASAALKSAPTKARVQQCFSHTGLRMKSSYILNAPGESRPGAPALVHFFWGVPGTTSGFSIGLCPLATSLNSIPSLSISSREAECPCDKVWGLSASDWQACSHHASACCLIRENVSVILGNVIYRGFLAVSVTQTDYGCWTFISLGVARKNCTKCYVFLW